MWPMTSLRFLAKATTVALIGCSGTGPKDARLVSEVSEVLEGDAGGPDCESVVFLDADGDGYGDPNKPACLGAGSSWVGNNLDCDDTDPNASPDGVAGRDGWSGEPRSNGSFDWNCDGVEELQHTEFATCPENGEPEITGGWSPYHQNSIPECGERSFWGVLTFFHDGEWQCRTVDGGRNMLQACR